MKKLNNKGFTLIELLAVIVVLAIIMVVTIPTVLNAMDKAKENQLQNAADSVEEWFEKQYELAAMGDFAGGADQTLQAWITTAYGSDKNYTSLSTQKSFGTSDQAKTLLKVAGISNADKSIDLANSSVQYNETTHKMCIKLRAKSGGSFYNSTDSTKNNKNSSGC